MDGLSIGKIARAANVSADTVRYYERMGLISAPPRAKSGYRTFSEADLRRLILIRRARDIGFSLEEIGELLALQPGADANDVQKVIQRRLEGIDRKLAEFHHWRAALSALQVVHANGGCVDGFLMRQLEQAQAPCTPHVGAPERMDKS
jgi:MerR family transcriptional regulator, copper efflux regulator